LQEAKHITLASINTASITARIFFMINTSLFTARGGDFFTMAGL
jgi:hypothetical protein